MVLVGAPPRSAYVHVPFCRHRCGYCDFALVAGRDELVDPYLAALARELGRVEEPLDLDTLYVGGGTPSHLGPTGLRRLFDTLRRRLRPVAGAEITAEANPADVDAALVSALADCGCTRVSLGAQSLDSRTLGALDRDHSPADVHRAVALLAAAGFTVSVDLMTAAPGQSLADVERDLDAVTALGSAHVSVYCLTWEKGTRFDSLRRRGTLVAAEEEVERAMLETTIDRLETAGLEHYEVSNFARPGARCRHNETYWLCRSWEGFGPGAARFDGRVRTTNHRSPTTWMRRVLAGADATGDREELSPLDAARERVVLGLRRRDGVERDAFERASGRPLDDVAGAAIGRWVAAGLASDDGAVVRLTRAGLLVSDALWGDVLAPPG